MKLSCRVVLGVLTGSLLGACGGVEISSHAERWECSSKACVVEFSVSNESNNREWVSYRVRAHRVRTIPGGEGARRNEVVGEFAGEAALLGLESRKMSQSISVSAKPTQVVVSAWVRDDF
jgi:hypothetical protein